MQIMIRRIIHGYVGNSEVIAYIEPGRDSGLSHFRILKSDKFPIRSYFGSVEFTRIISEKTEKI